MTSIIQIKHGNGCPADGVLTNNELGYDCKNKMLYIGQEGSSEPIGGLFSLKENEQKIDSLNNKVHYLNEKTKGNKKQIEEQKEQIKKLKDRISVSNVVLDSYILAQNGDFFTLI